MLQRPKNGGGGNKRLYNSFVTCMVYLHFYLCVWGKGKINKLRSKFILF
jgi:hypothetical protein